MLTAKNLQCMRALLSLAHCHGSILGSSWHLVLTTLQVQPPHTNFHLSISSVFLCNSYFYLFYTLLMVVQEVKKFQKFVSINLLNKVKNLSTYFPAKYSLSATTYSSQYHKTVQNTFRTNFVTIILFFYRCCFVSTIYKVFSLPAMFSAMRTGRT